MATQFRKADSKLISYSSGGSNTTVDYLMTWKQDRRGLKVVKQFPGEEVVSLHQLMVCDLGGKEKLTCSAREIQAKEEGVEVEESSSKEEI